MKEYLTLSAGIRAGKIYPQTTGAYAAWDNDQDTYRLCALGAACVSAGYAPEKLGSYFDGHRILKETYGNIFDRVYIHPVLMTRRLLDDIIISLNDTYQWTFDEIADWLQKEGL